MCCQREVPGKIADAVGQYACRHLLWGYSWNSRVSWATLPMVSLALCINMPLAEGNVFDYAWYRHPVLAIKLLNCFLLLSVVFWHFVHFAATSPSATCFFTSLSIKSEMPFFYCLKYYQRMKYSRNQCRDFCSLKLLLSSF